MVEREVAMVKAMAATTGARVEVDVAMVKAMVKAMVEAMAATTVARVEVDVAMVKATGRATDGQEGGGNGEGDGEGDGCGDEMVKAMAAAMMTMGEAEGPSPNRGKSNHVLLSACQKEDTTRYHTTHECTQRHNHLLLH